MWLCGESACTFSMRSPATGFADLARLQLTAVIIRKIRFRPRSRCDCSVSTRSSCRHEQSVERVPGLIRCSIKSPDSLKGTACAGGSVQAGLLVLRSSAKHDHTASPRSAISMVPPSLLCSRYPSLFTQVISTSLSRSSACASMPRSAIPFLPSTQRSASKRPFGAAYSSDQIVPASTVTGFSPRCSGSRPLITETMSSSTRFLVA